jgi:hypothetical protein
MYADPNARKSGLVTTVARDFVKFAVVFIEAQLCSAFPYGT